MADDIKTCRELDQHLAPYVDGEETPAARRSVEAHLAKCPPCHDRADAERSVRALVIEHRAELREPAPAALRARCAGLHALVAARQSAMSRVRRWMPLSLAASLVLAIAGVFLFGLNDRVEALAASLAIDHVKCFKVTGAMARADASRAQWVWQQDQGWPIVVPETAPGQQLTLVKVRRCFSTDGRAAHMMYTWRGAPLSLFVLSEPDGNAGRDRVLDKMGHTAVIWCANRRTYALIVEGHPQDLSPVIDYMKAHAR
jgi:anti-sigma factor (TIGR02949 family)